MKINCLKTRCTRHRRALAGQIRILLAIILLGYYPCNAQEMYGLCDSLKSTISEKKHAQELCSLFKNYSHYWRDDTECINGFRELYSNLLRDKLVNQKVKFSHIATYLGSAEEISNLDELEIYSYPCVRWFNDELNKWETHKYLWIYVDNNTGFIKRVKFKIVD